MPKRVESPSSINTFKQCPRKYYYQYLEKLKTLPSIHTVRGNIAHSVLEDFFDINTNFTADQAKYRIHKALQLLLVEKWKSYQEKLDFLKLSPDQIKFYFEETMMMLLNWGNQFHKKLAENIAKGQDLQEAFIKLTPIREQEYRSDNYSVRGFIDAIQHVEDEVHIIDYKTNSRSDIKSSIRLQLSIYCLLYFEKHGKNPKCC